MKFITKFVAKFLEDVWANFAQLALILFVLPILCIIMSKTNGDDQLMGMVLDMLGKVEIFNVVTDAVSAFLEGHNSAAVGNEELYLYHVGSVFGSVDKLMFKLLNIGICVGICNKCHHLLGMRGMHILSSMIGVFLGYFVSANYDIPIMASAFVMLLYVVIDMMFFRELGASALALIGQYFLSGLELGIEMLCTLLITGFVCILLIIWQGQPTNVAAIIIMLVSCLLPWLLLSLVKRYVFNG